LGKRARWAALAALALLLWGTVTFVPLPSIVLLRFRPPATTAFIELRKAKLRAAGKPGSIARSPVPLAAVSPSLVRAVLAAEDSRFYLHHGIDWDAVREAREYNRAQEGRRRPKVRGASTITQQLAKNLYLSPDRSLFRKAREAAIATSMEWILPKERILEHYLSAAEWGESVFGCEAAAKRYFGVSCKSLGPSQAAWLAAMLPGPAWYRARPAVHERRAARIAARAARESLPLAPFPADAEGADEPPSR
jgi:monofunctional biosynthetic peptidoglycan transglycosylase